MRFRLLKWYGIVALLIRTLAGKFMHRFSLKIRRKLNGSFQSLHSISKDIKMLLVWKSLDSDWDHKKTFLTAVICRTIYGMLDFNHTVKKVLYGARFNYLLHSIKKLIPVIILPGWEPQLLVGFSSWKLIHVKRP